MTIRERGGKVQLIRNQYSSEKKRGVQVVLGSFDRYLSAVEEVDSILTEKLTVDERQQLEQWFEERAARNAEITIKFAPGSICDKLKLMAENYDPSSVSDDQIEQIKAGLSGLLQARRQWKKRQS